MQEVLIVRVIKAAILLSGHVVVHNEIDLRHIDASRQYIRRDQCCEEALSEIIDDLVTIADLEATNDDFRLNVTGLQTLLQLLSRVLSVDEYHCHGALQLGVKPNDEVNFLVFCHLHLKVLDTFKLLRLLLDWEVLILADNALSKVYNLVSVGGRVEAVLGCDINLAECLLQRGKALMVRCLFEQLVRLIVHNHL